MTSKHIDELRAMTARLTNEGAHSLAHTQFTQTPTQVCHFAYSDTRNSASPLIVWEYMHYR
jgi:hypothetical protein